MSNAANTDHPSYDRNLIYEAVCEVRFVPQEDAWNPTVYGRFSEKLKAFTKIEQVSMRQVLMASDVDAREPTSKSETIGRFALPDNTRVYQIGESMYTASAVKSYPGWEGFLPLVKDGFLAYTGVVGPKAINRIGLRYINRLERPVKDLDFRDWFNVGPLLPESMYRDLGSYFLRFEMRSSDVRLVVTTGTVLSDRNDYVEIMVDLDRVVLREMPVSWDNVANEISSAHEHVWQAFEQLCTEKTVEYMKGGSNEPK